jgi:hypothetical protein
MNLIETKKYEEIKKLIKECTSKFLNNEYEEIACKALDKLSRKRNVPFVSGKENTWACGIVYAIGQANFLFDKSSKPYIPASELADSFGVAKSTAGNKANEISKMLKINYSNHEWILPSSMDDDLMIWMFDINGFYMDIRNCPIEVQIKAYNEGKIPYVPALKMQGINIIKNN